MATRKDYTATVTLTGTRVETPIMDWSVEDMHNEYVVFETLAKIWLETKGVPDHKQYMFILQLLGKEGLHTGNLPLAAPSNIDKKQPDCVWEAFVGSFRQNIGLQ